MWGKQALPKMVVWGGWAGWDAWLGPAWPKTAVGVGLGGALGLAPKWQGAGGGVPGPLQPCNGGGEGESTHPTPKIHPQNGSGWGGALGLA